MCIKQKGVHALNSIIVILGFILYLPLMSLAGQPPQWMTELPEDIRHWLTTIRYTPKSPNEPWGLFTFSSDSRVPYSLVSTAMAWLIADRVGGIEKLPGYESENKEKIALFVQKFQDPETGYFIDPFVEAMYTGSKDEQQIRELRAAVTKLSKGLLSQCDAKPLYDIPQETVDFDVQQYENLLASSRWNSEPWDVASHAAYQTVALYRLVNEGYTEYELLLNEGVDQIFSYQNQETGLWGSTDMSLEQQIGGALKVIGRLQFSMGLIVPNMDRLTDTLLMYHNSGEFSAPENYSVIMLRNAAELIYASMEASDYRKDELDLALEEMIEQLRAFQQPDGGFSLKTNGSDPLHWNEALIALESQNSRSDANGTLAVLYTLFEAYEWMNWEEDADNWSYRPKLFKNNKDRYKVYVDNNGDVFIEEIKPVIGKNKKDKNVENNSNRLKNVYTIIMANTQPHDNKIIQKNNKNDSVFSKDHSENVFVAEKTDDSKKVLADKNQKDSESIYPTNLLSKKNFLIRIIILGLFALLVFGIL